ncbi:MAG: cell division protein FtsA [Pseudomonadota bacterium]
MSRRPTPQYLFALDVGTSKVAALVGEITAEGKLQVVGLGQYPNKGLKKGVIANIDATVLAIQRAVENAEHMANCRASMAYVAIAGAHIKSVTKSGVAAIKHHEVQKKDVDAVIENGSAIPVPADQQVLHVIAQEFVVDGQEGIQDPVGMSAVRLDVNVHIITGSVSAAQNLYKCVEKCGLQVEKLVISHLASAHAVLTDDEIELGICCLDIGGGTTDISVYQGGAIRHTAVLPIAGDQVTNDIAVAFRTPAQHAENIKLHYGCAQPWMVQADEQIEAPSVGEGNQGAQPRTFSRSMLAEVIRPRYEELFRYVAKELHRADMLGRIPGGVVLTGGAAQMAGVVELAEEVLEVPVRLGFAHGVEGIDAVSRDAGLATGAGLLLYAKKMKPELVSSALNGGSGPDLLARLKDWFKGNF